MSIVIAIVLFSLIILFHELGHFLLAKANGVRVNEFCLGLGPTIVGFKKGETKYSLKLLPFGGACMMEGEDSESGDKRAFFNKPVGARFSVILAGPFFNFLLAFIFSYVLISSIGYCEPVLTDVTDGYPAQQAGMQAGDEIVKMNHMSIHFYDEISAYSLFHEGEAVEVTYIRDGKRYTTTLQPQYDEESGRYLYGFLGTYDRTKGNIYDTAVHAVYQVRYWIYTTIQSIRMLFTGSVSVNELSGPVGIVKNMGEVYDESITIGGYYTAFINMLNWGILLSANLGVMNLLPLPALDGGRLVFLIVEAVRRKKIDPNKEGLVHFIGIVLLLILMVVVMFNDIRKIFIA